MQRPPLLAARQLTAPLGLSRAPVLRGVDFHVGSGERVLLTGPSGSGKSTLLRCLVLLEPSRGSILLDGTPVTPARVREARRSVAYVPQQPVAVVDTVEENLAFPRSLGDAALDRAAQGRLLGRMGLGDLETDRRFDTLSGGEQQRVALVRSLTAGPRVLLLDEPTASLDPANVEDVVEVLRDWVEADDDRALVWVSHHTRQVVGMETRRVAMDELSG